MTWNSAINDEETAEVILTLIVLSHPDFVEDIRLVNDTVDHDHDGNTYQAAAFDVSMPDQIEGRAHAMRWNIQEVDEAILTQIRDTDSAVSIDVSWVLASDIETIHTGPVQAEIRSYRSQPGLVSCDLTLYPVLDEAVNVIHRASKADFPGLF